MLLFMIVAASAMHLPAVVGPETQALADTLHPETDEPRQEFEPPATTSTSVDAQFLRGLQLVRVSTPFWEIYEQADVFPGMASVTRLIREALLGDPTCKVVVVLGQTGHGRSTLLNMLSAGPKYLPLFATDAGCTSRTESVQIETIKWLGSGEKLVVVDTPGMSRVSSGVGSMDSETVSDTVAQLKRLDKYYSGVSRFLIVANGSVSGVNGARHTFNQFREALTQTQNDGQRSVAEWLSFVTVVATRWSYETSSCQMRELEREAEHGRGGGDPCEEAYNRRIREHFSVDAVPCVFVDSIRFTMIDDLPDKELSLYDDELEKLRTQIFTGSSTFRCQSADELEATRLRALASVSRRRTALMLQLAGETNREAEENEPAVSDADTTDDGGD